MTINEDTYSEDAEFELCEVMKQYTLAQLHSELTSPIELNRFVAARLLHQQGDETTFNYALALAKLDDARFREIAAFVLGQLGMQARPFLTESLPVLKLLLANDSHSKVRAAAATSLGHLAAPDSIACLDRAITDTDAKVRAGIAFALGETQDERAIPSLLALSQDSDPDVICWAVLGMRALGNNSSAIRDRFAEMLNDDREDIREEAICGLAELKDERAFSALEVALCQEEINLDLLDAAGTLGDPRLLPRLNSLLEGWADSPPKALQCAILAISKGSV